MSLIFHLRVRQQPIVRRQVRRRDGHFRGRRRRLMAMHELRHRRTRQRSFRRQQHTQSIVHQRLALSRRQVQDSQIFPVRLAGPTFMQGVVGHAKPTRREQILAVLVVGEGAGLAHQPVDDVSIVDAMLVVATQTRQSFDALRAVPHLQVLGINPHVDALAHEAAMHRVEVALHAYHAAFRHRHRHVLATLQAPRRQRPQPRPLLSQAFLPARVPPPRHLAQKGRVLRPAGEIPAATQQQRLRHRVLEVPMRRLRVAVLVARRRVRLLHYQTVVIH
jgi:hypothetical protein